MSSAAAPLHAMVTCLQPRQPLLPCAPRGGRSVGSASTWSLARLEALADEIAVAFYALLEVWWQRVGWLARRRC